jgi:hypothetical protein
MSTTGLRPRVSHRWPQGGRSVSQASVETVGMALRTAPLERSAMSFHRSAAFTRTWRPLRATDPVVRGAGFR